MKSSIPLDSSNGMQPPAKPIALVFGVTCYVASVVLGMTVERPLNTLLWESLAVFLVTYAAGFVVGWLMQRAVDRALDDHRRANPIPTYDPLASGTSDADAGGEILV